MKYMLMMFGDGATMMQTRSTEWVNEMMAFMEQHPERIKGAMGVVNVAKYLERIADHATNIAEEVIFMVAGHDVRHESQRAEPIE